MRYGNSSGYTSSVDMWSLGVILFILLTKRPPFSEDNNNQTLYSQIENVVYEYDQEPKLSNSVKDLISKLLVLEPEKRLTAKQALNHPWLKQYTSTTQSSPFKSSNENNKKRTQSDLRENDQIKLSKKF